METGPLSRSRNFLTTVWRQSTREVDTKPVYSPRALVSTAHTQPMSASGCLTPLRPAKMQFRGWSMASEADTS